MRSFVRWGWLVLLLSAASAAEPERAADWAQFRGPGGLGVSPDRNVPVSWGREENIVWKRELPGRGSSSPVIVGGRVFLTCYSGPPQQVKRNVVCLDRATGEVLWDKEVESKLPEQPRIRDDHGYATNTPAADPDRVFAFFGKSGVFAFDHDGRQLWHADVGSGLSGWGSAASPVLVGDLVIVNASVESESLVALDRRTGKEVWKADDIRESWNTPLLVTPAGGKPELVVAVFGKLFGFDPATGERLWSCTTDIGWYMVPSLVAEGGIVYCVGGRSGGGLAVRAGGRGDVPESHRLWTARKGSNVPSPVVHRGHLYWANDNLGVVYCAEARTGQIVYEERLERAGQVYASPVLAGDKLYYVTRDGRTFVLPAGPRFEVLAVNDLRDRGAFNSSPAVAGGRLFLRSDRHLYCIGKKE